MNHNASTNNLSKDFLSKIVMGGVQFGLDYGITNRQGKVSLDECRKILHFASENGCQLIDTAATYGESESAIGSQSPAAMHVITKFKWGNELESQTTSFLLSQLERSLDRLRRKRAWAWLAHDAKQFCSPAAQEAIRIARRDGLIERAGVSVYSPDELLICAAHQVDVFQAPANIFDQRFVSSNIVADLRKRGAEFHARSLYLQGVLLAPEKVGKSKLKPKIGIVHAFHQWANEAGLTAIEACLLFGFSSCIDRLVLGFISLSELQQSILAAHKISSLTTANDWQKWAQFDLELIDPRKWS